MFRKGSFSEGSMIGVKHVTSVGNHELQGFSFFVKSIFQSTGAKSMRPIDWSAWHLPFFEVSVNMDPQSRKQSNQIFRIR